MLRTAAFLALSLAALAPAPAALTVRDIDGRTWTPLAPAQGEVNLLVFVTTDCPISNRYAPEVGRIAAEYSSRHVRTFLVYTDPALDVARVRAHTADFHAAGPLPAIIDTGLKLTTEVDVTVTPEVAVYSAAGRAYRGRIDDLYVNIGQMRREPTRRDLRLALDAVLAGHPVAVAETQAVGCFIERTKR